MAGDILNIGKSGLFAAQVGLSTAGHNIANANVPGYSRQTLVQVATQAQNFGYGFAGGGTQVADIRRFSDDFLNTQVRQAQSSVSALNAYTAQISQVDNMLSDSTSGLSPALQDFFKGVQDVSSAPSSVASRGAMLSSAESLASRFQGIDARLQEIREGVNSQIESNVTVINSYAQQIAVLNEQIGGVSNSVHNQPNDMLDARDQLISELNKLVKTTVVAGERNSLTVTIGSGQPLVVGKRAFELAVTTSATDQARSQVGYISGSKITVLAESSLSGGELGGLLEFRASSLDRAQNSLGRLAIGMAISFNEQHKLGVDQAGNMGQDFFTVAPTVIGRNINNNPTSTTAVTAVVSDPSKLTQSDYKLSYNGTDYSVTRLPNGTPVVLAVPAVPQTIDGIDFSVTGSAAAGDSFVIRPTINGASQFAVALSDRSRIAAAAPVMTDAPLANTGSGKISAGSVDKNYLIPGNALSAPVTLTFGLDPITSTPAFKLSEAVTVTVGGVPTPYAAGADIPYSSASGASVSFRGVSVELSGAPDIGDTFSIGPTGSGADDSRNMRLLGALQTKNILDDGKASFQGSYAELVGFVGNKTREVQVNGEAGESLLAQTRLAQQQVSGVNLDEEAADLLRYQQAYQAAGKVMQIASTLFDVLLSLGR